MAMDGSFGGGVPRLVVADSFGEMGEGESVDARSEGKNGNGVKLDD